MGQALKAPEQLITGMRMDRDEFMRRWDSLRHVKRAELIEGTVYVASPVGLPHCAHDAELHYWLIGYKGATPGLDSGSNGTFYMLESAPQPDAYLRILPEYGGASGTHGIYGEGAPELIAEVCASSTEYDFGPKLALYQRAGVREYITADTHLRDLKWRVLEKGSYKELLPGLGGIIRSRVFPGLWLNPAHVWARDVMGIQKVLSRGLKSAAHRAFVLKLKKQRLSTERGISE